MIDVFSRFMQLVQRVTQSINPGGVSNPPFHGASGCVVCGHECPHARIQCNRRRPFGIRDLAIVMDLGGLRNAQEVLIETGTKESDVIRQDDWKWLGRLELSPTRSQQVKVYTCSLAPMFGVKYD